ncbi:MAG: disulfide bond formation protein B [Proteobacteria bacterium]|nr:disulfide bond formation protein B [Pseudomonadota bacterium]
MPRMSSRTVAALCAVAAALALGLALGSERFGGLVPCALCLWERWPYRVIIALGVAAVVLPHRARIALLWLIALALVAAGGLAFVHVGVEQKFWPSPLPECAAPHIKVGNIADMLASMPSKPAKPCDEPTYLLPFLPLSMAAMNMIFALAFLGALLAYLIGGTGRRARA